MKYFKEFISSILAGICISIGGAVYLICSMKGLSVLGSYLFSVGLLLILIFNLHLYTGKIGYVFDNKPKFIIDLGIIFIGNLVGTIISGYSLRLTRLSTTLNEKVIEISTLKLEDNIWSILVLSILCGFLVYAAVASWKNEKLPGIARFLMVVLCIGTFVACGFEHVVANMFYFSFANVWSLKAIGYILLMGVGNSLGAFLIPLFQKLNVR